MSGDLIMILMFHDLERTVLVDVVRKLGVPINARVSVFDHVIYPVLNSISIVFYVQVLLCG
jgi:hypothetical protein